jgi:hypothetical protein
MVVCSLKGRRIYLRLWATEVPLNSASCHASRARLREKCGLADLREADWGSEKLADITWTSMRPAVIRSRRVFLGKQRPIISSSHLTRPRWLCLSLLGGV